MKTRIFLNTILFVMALGLSACGGGDDAPAPVDPESGAGTLADPYIIENGKTYKATIPIMDHYSHDLMIWFKFTAPTTGYYTGTVHNPSTDLVLEFNDSSMSLIGNCGKPAGSAEVCNTQDIPYQLMAGSSYFIGVDNYTNAVETDFQITINPN